MAIDFRKSASIDDVVGVRSTSQRIGGARLTLAQDLHRGADHLVHALVDIALVDRSGKPLRLPAAIRLALDAG